MAEIVGFRPEHRDGFGDLVRATLAEFGFAEDPAMDGDLRDPAGAYAALWVVVDHGRVCGTAAVREPEPGVVEVKRMYLAPELRGRGFGRALLERVTEWAREAGARSLVLDTADSMVAAQRLYEQAGFRRTGERWEKGEREQRHEVLYALSLEKRPARARLHSQSQWGS